MAERAGDQESRRPAADKEHEQDDPQGQGRPGAAAVVPAGRLARKP
jgi:hypothetical protein